MYQGNPNNSDNNAENPIAIAYNVVNKFLSAMVASGKLPNQVLPDAKSWADVWKTLGSAINKMVVGSPAFEELIEALNLCAHNPSQSLAIVLCGSQFQHTDYIFSLLMLKRPPDLKLATSAVASELLSLVNTLNRLTGEEVERALVEMGYNNPQQLLGIASALRGMQEAFTTTAISKEASTKAAEASRPLDENGATILQNLINNDPDLLRLRNVAEKEIEGHALLGLVICLYNKLSSNPKINFDNNSILPILINDPKMIQMSSTGNGKDKAIFMDRLKNHDPSKVQRGDSVILLSCREAQLVYDKRQCIIYLRYS